MLAPELIQQIKHLELKAKHLVSDTMAGAYASAFRGMGMEFEKVREYVPGDDIRTIDWNVTARTNAPFVKVYREERELNLYVLVDISGSMHFGSKERFKNELAAELAAVLSFLVSQNNDKIGLMLFSDQVELHIPAKKGRSHVWNLIRSALTYENPQHQKTNIGTGLESFLRVCKKKSLVFLVSDFWDTGYEKSLQMVAKRHDLTCVQIADPWEQSLPKSAGIWSLQDGENPESRAVIDLGSKSFSTAYNASMKRREDTLKKLCAKLSAGYFQVSPQASVIHPLSRYLHSREKRHG